VARPWPIRRLRRCYRDWHDQGSLQAQLLLHVDIPPMLNSPTFVLEATINPRRSHRDTTALVIALPESALLRGRAGNNEIALLIGRGEVAKRRQIRFTKGSPETVLGSPRFPAWRTADGFPQTCRHDSCSLKRLPGRPLLIGRGTAWLCPV